MTDSTRQPGDIPERSNEGRPFDGDSSPETAAHGTEAAGASAATPAASPAPSPEAAASSAAAGSESRPAEAPASPSHTAAYPTDAFGQPTHAGQGSAHTFNPYTTGSAPGFGHSQPGQPVGAQASGTPAVRRKGGAALVAALAVGALLGGASGAGVTALVMANQPAGVATSQPQGPTNVVVNDTERVNQITAVAAKASPSVVTIEVSSGQQAGTGSGVILTDDGYVITNTHVVTLDGAASDVDIQVKANDGKLYSATVVGTDPVSDLAVIKLKDAQNLQPISWADSSKLNVGDSTIAIGAPLGLSGTVTNGIVSALNRSITVASSAAPSTPEQTPDNQGNGPFDFYFDVPGRGQAPSQGQAQSSVSLSVVQTDAAINPGNSGGALLNGKGELIGINVAIANAGGSSGSAGNIGVGFALPSNLAKRISEEIIKSGKATHGLLGASVGDAASDPSSATVGAMISEVTSGGAAEKAGLRKGDIVTTFNGVPVTDANDLTAQVRSLPSGGKAELTYMRGDQSVTVSVTVGELAS